MDGKCLIAESKATQPYAVPCLEREDEGEGEGEWSGIAVFLIWWQDHVCTDQSTDTGAGAGAGALPV